MASCDSAKEAGGWVGLQASFCCCCACARSYAISGDPSARCLLAREGGDYPGSPEEKYVYLTQNQLRLQLHWVST